MAFDIAKFANTLSIDQLSGPRNIDTITAEILGLKQRAGSAILGIGHRLIEAKSMLPHGEWLPWLTNQVEFSERTAQDFMRLAREWSNPQTFADLGPAKALIILSLPPDEREQFISEPHDIDGKQKTAEEMSVRDLKKIVKCKTPKRTERDGLPCVQSGGWQQLTSELWPKTEQLVVLSRVNVIGGIEYQLARCVAGPENECPFVFPNDNLTVAEPLTFDHWISVPENV